MCILFCSYNIDVNHKSKLSSLQDIKIKQLEEQVQELENFISSLQKQMKEYNTSLPNHLPLQSGFKSLESGNPLCLLIS
jgi:peptidoglycan hydrolase CwlO-like protein